MMRGQWQADTARTIDLGYDQLLVLQSRPGTRVRVLYGSMWLTEEGTAQDVFAGSGDEVALKARGRAVIEGMGVARVQVIEPSRSVQFMRRLRAAVVRVFTRRPQLPAGVMVPR
jgi:hypothetical protein